MLKISQRSDYYGLIYESMVGYIVNRATLQADFDPGEIPPVPMTVDALLAEIGVGFRKVDALVAWLESGV